MATSKPKSRLLVEIPLELKQALKARIALEGLTLKQWVLIQAQNYLRKGR